MSKRQDIIDEIDDFFGDIQGLTVFCWKTTEISQGDLPAVVYRDTECTRVTDDSAVMGAYTWDMRVEIEIYATGASESDCAAGLRSSVDDIIDAIGTGCNTQWSGNATFTEISDTIKFEIERKEYVIGRAIFGMNVRYTTDLFST